MPPILPASDLTLPAISQDIWEAKYRFKSTDGAVPGDASLNGSFQRVAQAAASVEKGGKRARERWAEEFVGAMADLGFLPGGRILAGAGTGRTVTLFNCFVMGRIDDDLGAIFEQVKEAALTMQAGGGIGHDFSTLRPRGALVSSIGADASGPVSFMDVWDAMCRTIMSAGARRGAMMATLRCDHPDIEEFIAAKADAGRLRNFNLSVLVTDRFMAAVKAGEAWDLQFDGTVYRTLNARDLWDRLMRSAYDTAEPGVIFIDRINARNNLNYCEDIHTTNPCVTSETWVHTDRGPKQVSELVARPFVARIDGGDWNAPDGFFATGTKPVVKVKTKDGRSVRLTPNHKILTVKRHTRHSEETCWRQAGDLVAGDLIVISNHRARTQWPGEGTFEQGYLLGLLIGDGTLKEDEAVLSVWRAREAANGPSCHGADGIMDAALKAAKTLPHRSDFSGWSEVTGRSEWRLKLAAVRDLAFNYGMKPGYKPIDPRAERTSSDFHRGLMRGLFDADGSVQGNQQKGLSVRLSQSDLDRLEAAQRMLLRLGINSTLYTERRPDGFCTLPDGKGGSREYPTRAQHELVVSGDSLHKFSEGVGFSDFAKQGRLTAGLSSYKRSPNQERFFSEVLEVEPDGEADVFDVSVPGCNAFDANGLVVHNCGEQPLPEYGACLLGSINLAALVRQPFTASAAIDSGKLESRVATAIRLLDNIIDVSDYPLSQQRREAKAKRRIGLGVTGLADALIMLGQRYGAPDACATAGGLMRTIQNAAYAASAGIARDKGAFALFDKKKFLRQPNVEALDSAVRAQITAHGIRNGCLTSIAPTGTISLLAGNVSSGIEPVFDFVFNRRIREASGASRVETVEDFAHAAYRRAFGDATALPPAFVRTNDLLPSDHLAMQAALQPHVDSAISKTINCPEGLSFEAFRDVYAEAYALGLKGCTAYRPNPVTGSILSAVVPDAVSEPALQTAQGSASMNTQGELTDASAAVSLNKASSVPAAAAAPSPVPARHAAPADGSAEVVYMTKPLTRAGVLEGATYKLKWSDSDHAIYITLNDMSYEVPAPGGGVITRHRPFEIFINSGNLEHYAWTVALTRMISAVFRRGGDVTFVADELKAIFDPQGGRWVDGRYVPSLLAAIGEVIETHMIKTGFLASQLIAEVSPEAAINYGNAGASEAPGTRPFADRGVTSGRLCPRCSSVHFLRQEGCWTCRSCGFSRCG